MAETLPITREPEVPKLSARLEQALIEGDLKGLTVPERVEFYNAKCQSVGLNALTQPFGYIVLNGKLTLYALKAATDQLRQIHGVSIGQLREEEKDGLYTVFAPAVNRQGRTDEDMGAVSIKGLAGDALCNAKMKAITKAKRRVTLSICGLGMLDETEVTSIAGARTVREDEPVVPPLVRPRRLATPAPATSLVASSAPPASSEPDKPLVLSPEENARLDRALAAAEQTGLPFSEDPAAELREQNAKDPGRPGAFISREQVVRLIALCKEHGKSEEGLKTHLVNQYGVESRARIPRVLYEAICAWVERKPEERKPQARLVYRRQPVRR